LILAFILIAGLELLTFNKILSVSL